MQKRLLVVLLVTASLADPGQCGEDPLHLIGKAVDAHGGAEKVSRMLTYQARVKGAIHAPKIEPLSYEMEYSFKAPDCHRESKLLNINGRQLYSEHIFDKGKLIRLADGVELPSSEKIEKVTRTKMRIMNAVALLPLLDEKRFSLLAQKQTTDNGTQLIGVVVRSAGSDDFELYFERSSMLLNRVVFPSINSRGEPDTDTVIYSDYRDLDGLRIYGKVTYTNRGPARLVDEIVSFRPINVWAPDAFDLQRNPFKSK